jgi:hypothetical protein
MVFSQLLSAYVHYHNNVKSGLLLFLTYIYLEKSDNIKVDYIYYMYFI